MLNARGRGAAANLVLGAHGSLLVFAGVKAFARLVILCGIEEEIVFYSRLDLHLLFWCLFCRIVFAFWPTNGVGIRGNQCARSSVFVVVRLSDGVGYVMMIFTDIVTCASMA